MLRGLGEASEAYEVDILDSPGGSTVEGKRATVDIRYDLSYQIATDMGDKWERRQNDKRLELEYDGQRWLFLSGY